MPTNGGHCMLFLTLSSCLLSILYLTTRWLSSTIIDIYMNNVKCTRNLIAAMPFFLVELNEIKFCMFPPYKSVSFHSYQHHNVTACLDWRFLLQKNWQIQLYWLIAGRDLYIMGWSVLLYGEQEESDLRFGAPQVYSLSWVTMASIVNQCKGLCSFTVRAGRIDR